MNYYLWQATTIAYSTHFLGDPILVVKLQEE